MKKLGLGILISLVALAISSGAMAISDQAADKAKEKAKIPALEKIEFIHWKKGFAKPPCDNNGTCDPGENPSCADCKNGEEEPSTTCYGFMGQYGKRLLKWGETPQSYVINPTNSGLSTSFVSSAIFAGAEEWDEYAGTELFNNSYTVSTDPETSYGLQNYVNAISFGNYYQDPNIIGVATVWYSPATKTIVEFDIVFETDYTWGDCLGNEVTCKNNKVMDLQNIATHELGHGIGLADIYETECSEVTMYGYSKEGETKKRTLEEPDKTGLHKLYGNSIE